ncbi:triphosphoribosyl-dephospho-CoA synthase [Thiobacillus sp.]|uniref:triphosphoribosyl-dephospho-CoA synthase n=1 Tax=Thiobacillus sp. TaxID=924 RepID=UPI0025D06D38|nr:triphosphoribosyl-dephospho-CoA synthase [Thiobacillus sp.]
MNAPMLRAAVAPQLSDLFLAACEMDVVAFKPGNVSWVSPGHGMTAEDFLISAKAAAPHVADPDLHIGERIYRAVEATREAVGCNTNLGIVLLAVPLIHAAQHCMPGDILAHRLQRSLAALTRDDAEWVYRAIRLAAPGGLGESPRHDVRETPVVTLLEAMQEAAAWDRIAYQYTHCYADVLGPGLLSLHQGRMHWGSETAAVTTAYLGFLAGFSDSHIWRKHGRSAAGAVRTMAFDCIARLGQCADWTCAKTHLTGLDTTLKSTGFNPGTSADLTVATWLADRLLHGEATCIPNHAQGDSQFV